MKTVKVDVVHMDSDHKTSNHPTVDDGLGMGDPFQVVLFNDDHNTAEHVVRCLVRVFGHSVEMAKKLMLEAHHSGKTIAQVETRSRAIFHADQLQKAGLQANVEAIQ